MKRIKDFPMQHMAPLSLPLRRNSASLNSVALQRGIASDLLNRLLRRFQDIVEISRNRHDLWFHALHLCGTYQA